LWLGLGLGLLILLFYANSFSAGLTLDNKVVITGDPRIRALDYEHLKLIFTKTYWWPNLEETGMTTSPFGKAPEPPRPRVSKPK
jgi:hypothetical protein